MRLQEPVTSIENKTEALVHDTLGSMGLERLHAILHMGHMFLYNALYLAIYRLPSIFFQILGMRISVTLSLSTILFFLISVVVIAVLLVRYRYLTKYSRLPKEPKRKEPPIDLLTDSQEAESRSGLGNYLDEFLRATKVFGYLEKPVFHELAQHMQTKKLIAGDTLQLEDEKGFCLVVDGLIQVFVKSSTELPNTASDADSDELNQKYQLLTEISNGTPMSSMFSILALFTEDIKLPHDSRDMDQMNNSIEKFTKQRSDSLCNDKVFSSTNLIKVECSSVCSDSIHPDIVARASIDTTIAIIPAEAFRRLTRIYPKAAAHIVQVILTRFQRVTFLTGHNYLGLTSEILQTDKLMNEYTTYELPNYLRDGSLESLRERFAKAKASLSLGDHKNGIVLPTRRRSRRRSPSIPRHLFEKSHAKHVVVNSLPNPGDLLSTTPLNRTISKDSVFKISSGSINSNKIAASTLVCEKDFENSDEMISLRDSVLACLLRAIGLVEVSNDSKLMQNHSEDSSPKMVSYDSVRQKAIFSKSNGTPSSIDDSESIESLPSLQSIHEELDNEVELVHYPQGVVLFSQGERNPGLYYVIDGFLEVSISESKERGKYDPNLKEEFHIKKPYDSQSDFNATLKNLFLIKPGGLAGYVESVTGSRSLVDVRAKTDAYVGYLPHRALEHILEKQPIILLTMAKRMTSFIPRVILHLDFALEWVQVPAGQIVYKQGKQSDAIYIVLNGRLRLVNQKGTSKSVMAEYGQYESIGELEVLTETSRPGTLHAIRDTELVKFPRTLFNSLAIEHPGITLNICRIMASRMHSVLNNYVESGSHSQVSETVQNSTINLRTVCILPVNSIVPIVEFGKRLASGLCHIGSSVYTLNQSAILNHLGRHAFNKLGKLKLTGYLADLEERYRIVLYVADASVGSPWTQTCIAQADFVLLVAIAEQDPSIRKYEQYLIGTKTTARKELVLLHPMRFCPPGLTRQWLKNRIWIHGHHHVQMDVEVPSPVHRSSNRFSNLKIRVQTLQSEWNRIRGQRLQTANSVYIPVQNHKDDFMRLARRLCGKSVGLVLGGGGARGIAQIGFIRAMEEEGIPIDMIGGTSIGAFNGGLYARDPDVVPLYGRAKKFASRASSLWRMALDITYPVTSYLTGHDFNRAIWKTFRDSHIEDFWLPFYANTSNISESKMEIHSSGYAWRYIRASMTLAGLLPPLADEGHMLLDGGYMDNLTVSHMRSLGADIIFAVDVGRVDDNAPMEYGDSLSGFWVIFNRWNPFSTHPNVPTLAEIQARLAYVGSVDALEKAKAIPGCFYARPPIDAFGTLEFSKFNEIYEVGYKHGKDFFINLKKQGLLQIVGTKETKGFRQMAVVRRNSL